MNNTISKIFPEELRRVRLGMCYNSQSKEILFDKARAFDLTKVPSINHSFESGLGNFNFTTSSHSSASVFELMLGLNAEAEVGFSMCKGSVSRNMSLAHATSSNYQKICGYLSYTILGASMSVMSSTPKNQYQWMSKDFQDLYTELVNPEDNKTMNKINAYMKFRKYFGDGVVTKVDLTSGAYGKFEITSSNEAKSNQYALSASASIATVKGGASVSAMLDWKEKNATKDSQLSITTDWYPSTSPAKIWVNELYKLGIAEGMPSISDSAKLYDLPIPKEAKLPNFPKYIKPDVEKELPKNSDIDIEPKEENSTDIEDALKEMKDNFSVTDLVDESNEIIKSRKRSQSLNLKSSNLFDESIKDSFEPSIVTNDISVLQSEIGDYIPCGFRITPWEEIFPDLKLNFKPTLNSMFMAKLNMFYYTRLQFGQYLKFLSQLPYEDIKQDNMDFEVRSYFNICDTFLNTVIKDLSVESFDKTQYEMIINSFDESLKNLEKNGKFTNRNIYNIFFNNYGFFENNAYGVIPNFTAINNLYPSRFYPSIYLEITPPISGDEQKLKKMLAHAVRLYPIINKDGSCHLTFYSKGRWETSLFILSVGNIDMGYSMSTSMRLAKFKYNSLNELMHVIERGLKSHSIIVGSAIFPEGIEIVSSGYPSHTSDVIFKSIGHKDIGDGMIRGIAMFESFPFDSVYIN